MGMYHSTSGKNFYNPYFDSPHGGVYINKETLREVLIREEELRFSLEYLKGCDKAQKHKDLSKIRDLTVGIQCKALKEFGIDPTKGGLNVLNNARYTYKDDPEMNTLTVYMRQDRSTEGNLRSKTNQLSPNVALLNLQGEPTSLHHYLKTLPILSATKKEEEDGEKKETCRPVVILSGSLT